jgi:hypothetical protein
MVQDFPRGLLNFCIGIFTNGERGIYHCSNLLNFAVFQELKNQNYFHQVKVLHGAITCLHEQDICPDKLYLDLVKEGHNQ